MPTVANARHLMNWKRLSSATERGIGAVAVTFPPDVARRCDVSTTNRCIRSHKAHHSRVDSNIPYTASCSSELRQ